jgi:hypothetical protein
MPRYDDMTSEYLISSDPLILSMVSIFCILSLAAGLYLGPILAKRLYNAGCRTKPFVCPHCLAFWISFFTSLALFAVVYNMMDCRECADKIEKLVFFTGRVFVISFISYFVTEARLGGKV